jgi:hypothetical protein
MQALRIDKTCAANSDKPSPGSCNFFNRRRLRYSVRAERYASLSFGGEAVLVWLQSSGTPFVRTPSVVYRYRLMWASAREKMELLFTRGLFLMLATAVRP